MAPNEASRSADLEGRLKTNSVFANHFFFMINGDMSFRVTDNSPLSKLVAQE